MPRRVINPPPLDPAKTGAEAGERLPPILMRTDEVINLARAAHMTGKSPDTLRRWHQKYRIARQAGRNAALEFSVIAVEMVHHGDFEALELLRAGRRSDPAVQRYIEYLGLPT